MGWLGDGSHRWQVCQARTAVGLRPRYSCNQWTLRFDTTLNMEVWVDLGMGYLPWPTSLHQMSQATHKNTKCTNSVSFNTVINTGLKWANFMTWQVPHCTSCCSEANMNIMWRTGGKHQQETVMLWFPVIGCFRSDPGILHRFRSSFCNNIRVNLLHQWSKFVKHVDAVCKLSPRRPWVTHISIYICVF